VPQSLLARADEVIEGVDGPRYGIQVPEWWSVKRTIEGSHP
jgi:hypothetical protein